MVYYKEEIVDGILCCKESKDGEWIPLTQQQLTKKIMKLKVALARLNNQLAIAKKRVHEPI